MSRGRCVVVCLQWFSLVARIWSVAKSSSCPGMLAGCCLPLFCLCWEHGADAVLVGLVLVVVHQVPA